MNEKLLPCLLAIALTFGFASLRAAESPRHRVVVEVTIAGPEAWTGVINNIENLQKSFGATDIQIESVSHGKGLGLLLKTNTSVRERLERIAAMGVVFAACQNTMRQQKVTKEDLFPFVITVDSGVAEVVRKQEAGWSYLKPDE